ncbi:MAG TPA: hypothetical protein VFF94_06435, partial [Novosphingobium sp.]|nr:hypothetical protein [Novosphingobium sp.]
MNTARSLRAAGCALLTAASAVLAGCAVGPDFRAPPAPAGKAYDPQPIAAAAAPLAGGGQALSPTAPLPAEWWRPFHSPALDLLVAEALA